MRSLERHRDAGAYALGLLDAADAFRFEDHLADCPACLLALDELSTTTGQLALYCRVTPSAVEPCAAPSAGLLDGVLRETARRYGAGRGRRVGAAAACAVLVAAAPALAALTTQAPEPVRMSARDPRSGATATLTARDRVWGSEIGLTVRDAAARGRVCELVAVAADGSEQTVTTWRTPERAVRTRGASALRTGRTVRYEVRTADGKALLTLRRP
ncbi:zf-HC2 domain-containing protein [Streptomyces sp. NPDC005879]|uniref:zf-HC2 domain-containing protein n=2 Tax=unclassified Streptomyces TaxID=2593676 RepID=UPI00340AAD45